MKHPTVLLALLLAALVPSVASAEPASLQAIDAGDEVHARFGFAPIAVGEPASDSNAGRAHTLLVAAFGARFAVVKWIAITGSLGGAVVVKPGGEASFDGAAMPVPATLGVAAAWPLRDDLRLGGELRWSWADDTDDRIRAADVAASVYLHDAEMPWSQADRVDARGALTWTRGRLGVTGAVGVTQYAGAQSVLAFGAGVAHAHGPRTTLTGDAILYTDTHDEQSDEGYDVAGIVVLGVRHQTGPHRDLGFALSHTLVDRAEHEGYAALGLTFELRITH